MRGRSYFCSSFVALGIPTPQAMEAKTNSIDLEIAETAATLSNDRSTASCDTTNDKTLKELNASEVDVAGSASSIFRRGGIFPTAICLSKAAIGAGVLSVAAHSAEVGALYQFICLVHLGWHGLEKNEELGQRTGEILTNKSNNGHNSRRYNFPV